MLCYVVNICKSFLSVVLKVYQSDTVFSDTQVLAMPYTETNHQLHMIKAEQKKEFFTYLFSGIVSPDRPYFLTNIIPTTQMEYHTGQRYSDAVGYIRKRLRFEILRTTVISLRGDRGARKKLLI